MYIMPPEVRNSSKRLSAKTMVKSNVLGSASEWPVESPDQGLASSPWKSYSQANAGVHEIHHGAFEPDTLSILKIESR